MVSISIRSSDPLTIQAQIVEQIKYTIALGLWGGGYRLPPVREMAAVLKVNYHTVRVAYQVLGQEGYVETERGRGTYVARNPPRLSERQEELLSLIDITLYQAQALGIPATIFSQAMHARALQFAAVPPSVRVLLVECNTPDLLYYAATIEQHIGVRPEIMELADVAQQTAAFFSQFDVVATTLYHFVELHEMVGAQQQLLGLSVSISYGQTLRDLMSLPSGTSVGLICATTEKARGMKRDLLGHGITHLHFLVAAIDQVDQVEELFQRTQRVYVSRLGLSLQERDWPQPTAVRPYATQLDSSALRLLCSKLMTVAANVTDDRGNVHEHGK